MSRFPPSTNILRSVKMTRTAYAQLVGQKFFPPKIFGQWRENEDSKEYKWKDIGMKIVRFCIGRNCAGPYVYLNRQAVGFEMLYQESKNRSGTEDTAARESKVYILIAYFILSLILVAPRLKQTRIVSAEAQNIGNI